MEDGDSIGDGEGDCDGDVDVDDDEGVDNDVDTDSDDDDGNCDDTGAAIDDPAVDNVDVTLAIPGEFEFCDAILSSLNDFQLSQLYFRLFLAHGEGDNSRRDDTLTLVFDTTDNDFPDDRIILLVS